MKPAFPSSAIMLALMLVSSCATPTPATTTTMTTTATPTTTPPTPTTAPSSTASDDAAEAEVQRYVQSRQPGQQRLRTLDEAATAVDDHVVFEAPIAAVSYKNTKPYGTYLSFGAPYPQQTMSVWFAARVWEALPRRPRLHRHVRVEGVVRMTPTGPTIDVDDIAQLSFVRVDEAVLSDAALRARMSYSQLRLALGQLLERGADDDVTTSTELERIASTLATCVTCGSHAVFFSALELSREASAEDFARRRAQILAWRARFPTSTQAVLALAVIEIDEAWAARGAGVIDSVTVPQLQRFLEGLHQASLVLEQHPAVKTSPIGWRCWLKVALGQNWNDKTYLQLFNAAIARFPDDIALYGQAMHRLQPKWGGQPGDIERFVDEHRRRRAVVAGAVEGDKLYARLAWELDDLFPHAVFKATRLQWPIVAEGLEALIAQGDDVTRWRNVFAHLAFVQGDRRRLHVALEQLHDDEADMGLWINLQNVAGARRFAETGERPPVAVRIRETPPPAPPRIKIEEGALTGDDIDDVVDDDSALPE